MLYTTQVSPELFIESQMERAIKHYTNERNVQIVLFLLKAYGVRKVVASPGTTNVTLVASMQQDPWFEIYSSLDERSAAYMACGMSAESGEAVVLTCTGATASRNYIPGLTEAFYRKLPIIAITATQDIRRIGNLVPQVIDRRVVGNDVVLASEHIQFVQTPEDEGDCELKVNRLLWAAIQHGGGPVHLNLETRYSKDFSIQTLPSARVIRRFTVYDPLPDITSKNIAIFIGSHSPIACSLLTAIDSFCAKYGAVVLCDHTGNYRGEHSVNTTLLFEQDHHRPKLLDNIDLLIHIGEVSGAYGLMSSLYSARRIWRVSEDGYGRDTAGRLEAVFQMPEERFFIHYAALPKEGAGIQTNSIIQEQKDIINRIPDIPFSNLWVASQIAPLLPSGSSLHLGILNTLRCWSMFPLPQEVSVFSNVGGFGIDGNLSSVIGASLVSPNKLFYAVVGDLAFFYDINSLGNRHIGNNLRIILVNNGRGVEFRSPYHPCYQFGEDADPYMAAAGHFPSQNKKLVRHYASDLGYRYLTASTKEELKSVLPEFVTPHVTEKPIILEIFTSTENENEALVRMHEIIVDPPQRKQRGIKRRIHHFIQSLRGRIRKL